MSLIESDTRSLETRKREITQRAVDKILISKLKDKMNQKDYEECITYLCKYRTSSRVSYLSLHPLNPSHSPLLNSYSKDSNTSTLYNPTPYCNPHPSSEESIDFKLEIKDYDTFMPLENKAIQIKNIDSKETYIQTTNSKGEVLFTLKEEERGEFFHILLLNDKDYEQEPYHLARKTITNTQGQKTIKQTTQKILTPNSYPNYPARLFFRPKLSFYFDGNTLFVLKCKKVLGAYEARSGKALNQ